jgi:hypothetical protein
MKIFKITRSSEWWEYKLVPLLAIGYATLLKNDTPLYKGASQLLFLLLSVTIGAIYVSIINDITDITEDKAVGKSNRMAEVAPVWRIVISLACLLTGALFGYLMYPDILSMFLYAMAWVVFSLYSLPPIRLKKRGIWGPLCDALGAHFFPSLLMVSSVTYFTGLAIDNAWFFAVAIWSFCYGLRGILWHQFHDRDNDIKTGLKTYASTVDPAAFRPAEIIIILLELAAFGWMLSRIAYTLVFVSLVVYLFLIIIRAVSFNYKIVLIITPDHKPHQVLMADFYQVFLPLSLLCTAAFTQRNAWIILCVHIILFPQKTLLVIKDFLIFFRKIAARS